MVPEQATRIAMLKNGDVDIAMVDYDRIPDLVADGFSQINIGVPGTCSLMIQGSWLPNAGPVTNKLVREALSYAINRQEISDTLFAGFAVPGGQFYEYPGCYGWSDALLPDPYDPQKAEDLLAQAGYPNNWADPVIHLYTTAAGGLSGGPDLFLLLQSYWDAVGIQTELHIVDSTIFNNYMFSFVRLTGPEPNVGWIFCWNYQAFYNPTYQAANAYCSWGVHNSGNDPEADRLYLKAANEPDAVLAAQYFADFEAYARTMYTNIGVIQVPQIFLYNPHTIGAWAGRNWISYWDCVNGIRHP